MTNYLISLNKFLLSWIAMTAAFACSPMAACSQQSNTSVESNELLDASFYLDKAEERIEQLEAFVEHVKSTRDKDSLPFIELMLTERETKQIAERLKLARRSAKKLKAGSPAAIAFNQRFHQLATRLIDADELLLPLRHHLRATLDPSAFPELKDDARRLRGIATMYDDPRILTSDPKVAAIAISQLEPASREFERVLKKYNQLVRQKTTAGLQLRGLQRFFKSKRKSFESAAELAKTELPAVVQSLINEVAQKIDGTNAKDGLSDLVTTLPIQLRRIDDQIQLLAVLKCDVKTIRSSLQSIELKVRKMLDRFDPTTIQLSSDLLPDNRYQQPDREEIEASVRLACKKDFPSCDVASVFIPEAHWSRSKTWRYGSPNRKQSVGDQLDESAWKLIDRSQLAVCLVTTDSSNLDSKNFRARWYRVEKQTDDPQSTNLIITRRPQLFDGRIVFDHLK